MFSSMAMKPDKNLTLNGKLSTASKDARPLIEEDTLQRIICK